MAQYPFMEGGTLPVGLHIDETPHSRVGKTWLALAQADEGRISEACAWTPQPVSALSGVKAQQVCSRYAQCRSTSVMVSPSSLCLQHQIPCERQLRGQWSSAGQMLPGQLISPHSSKCRRPYHDVR